MDGAEKIALNVNGRWISARHNLPIGNLEFRAQNIRLERTGTHANIEIVLNGTVRAWSTFNSDRDEDRVRLANSAFKTLVVAEQKELPAKYLKAALDGFCVGLWDAHMGRYEGEDMGGDPELGAPTFTLKPYVLDAGGSLIYAAPGQGKSYTAMAMAVCATHGVNSLWPVRQRRMLYVNLERSRDSMVRRLSSINVALGLDAHTPTPFLNQRGRSLVEIREAAVRTMEKQRCEGVVLDSISRSGMGKLVEDQVGNKVVDTLNSLSDTWLAVAHTPRDDPSHSYGTVMFEAGEDIGIRLTASQLSGKTGIGLQITKANDIAIPPMQILTFEWGEHGLIGIRHAHSQEFVEIEATKATGLETEVEEYLLLGGDATAGEIAAAIGRNRSNVSAILTKSNKFIRTRRDGPKIFYGARGGCETEG